MHRHSASSSSSQSNPPLNNQHNQHHNPSARNLYPPSQPAPLYPDAENDYNETDYYLDSELISFNDPDQHLRLTRSATETIHEAISEDDRRRLAKKNRTKLNLDPTKKKFSRRISSRSSTLNSSNNHPHHNLLANLQQHPILPSSIFNPKLSSKLNPALKHNTHHDPSSSSSSSQANPQQPTQKFIPPMPIAPELDQDEEEAEDEHTRNLKELEDSPAADLQRKQNDASRQQRRSIYVNLVLPTVQVDKYGDPIATYVRNKVRTTKYTIITFIPKNMWEQFRNVANIYFLVLIIFQVFPVFGAATPQVAMLPLVFILSVTALKDAFEDYRRYMLDNSVNNAACTRLGDWKNVNVPKAGGGTWWENFEWPWEKNQHVVDSIGQVQKITKGVRKLREREKDTFNTDFLYANQAQRERSEDYRDHNNDDDADDALSDIQEGSAHQIGRSTTSLPPPSSTRRRSSSDLVDYSTPTAGTAKWERTLWKKLEVGDILLLREDEAIPADIVVLSTSDPDGQCFVETKNLDGETNLKPRRACKTTRSIGNEEDVEHSHFVVESEAPNANLYAFNASVKYWTKDETEGREHPLTEGRKLKKGSEKKEVIGINEILLRGCTLRNTQWVIGLVIFTGKDTKIMLNQGDTPSKKPKISRETNYAVIVNFIVLIVLCTINAIGDGILQGTVKTSATFFEVGASVSSNAILDALVTFGAALILFQSIVPISLVITLEFVRSIQALTIFRDIEMYYEPLNCPAEPKSWNLSDDLGQIEYIFSDKTGTLTQNVMEFQRCSISGISYGEGVTEAMVGAAKRRQADSSAIDDPVTNSAALLDSKHRMIDLMQQAFKHAHLNPSQLTLISPQLIEDLTNTESSNSVHRQRMIDFWKTLAICHDVISSRNDLEPNQIEYKAESPDEAALVAGARDVGFVFLRRMGDRVEIQVMGQLERYNMLQMIAFNSSRKRMSTIVRCPDGKIRLLCKGADSIIMSRLKPDQDEDLKRRVNTDLESFASDGLRTLLIASREVSEEEYLEFQQEYKQASDSPGKDREELMEKVADEFERGLEILGATALEDKLQVGVPEAIEKLHEAGIKLWILTGDKLQTAIEIGYSCNLLKNTMEIMILSSDTEAGTRSQIEQGLEKLLSTSSGSASSTGHWGGSDSLDRNDGGSDSIDKTNKNEHLGNSTSHPNERRKSRAVFPSPRPKGGYAVVIDGDTLRYALDGSLKANFLALTVQCETVVCCRVSPAQKALTVKLVKEGKNAMTLAIGDGANDVAMIQEAHIGVGIAGLEGAQASMSADYALGQFRFLTKLLLVHGRWCYIRIADMHANFFFKNIIWTLVLFWYQIYCSFNGSYLFEYTFIMLFNLVFTSLPVGLMGAFEQDLSANASMAFPALYKRGIYGLQYTRLKFWCYMLDGTYQSIVSFWIPYFVYFHSTTVSVTGRDVSIWEFGATVACGTVFAANNLIAINTRYFPTFIIIVLTLSSTLVLVWTALYSGLSKFYFKDVVLYTFSTIEFWASFILVQVLSLLPRAVYKYLQIQYWPRDSDIIREIIIGESYKNQHTHSGLEEDMRQLKLIEQVIEKDKLDRLESDQISTKKPSTQPQSSSPPYVLAPGSSGSNGGGGGGGAGGGATIPAAALTAMGRSGSVNRKAMAKGYHHQSSDSVEMTAVQPDYPSSNVPSITTTHPDDSSNRVRMDGLTTAGLVGYPSDQQAHVVDRRGSIGSYYQYSGLATSSPAPSPRETPIRQERQPARDSQISYSLFGSPPRSQLDHHSHQQPHQQYQQQQPRRFGLDDEQPPLSAHSGGSGWMSEEFITCNSHSQHQHQHPQQQQQQYHPHQSIGQQSGSLAPSSMAPPSSINEDLHNHSQEIGLADDLHSSHYSQISSSHHLNQSFPSPNNFPPSSSPSPNQNLRFQQHQHIHNQNQNQQQFF
ncbi:hypothetical protein PGTUg99_004464 [Puccinia graminis f. sp. tritici]|uniref:P-type phospholipid transporter n=1 Tax=Puccinia graminis f. sp. tritici TaxID=56615 RepID=A0A5B0PSJ0_PUCGR|nr:hypothetical protein PGTUg99_004464 [Puccinia graminis f. sp. tritici]